VLLNSFQLTDINCKLLPQPPILFALHQISFILFSKSRKPTAPSGGWVVGIQRSNSELSPRNTPAHCCADSSTYKSRK